MTGALLILWCSLALIVPGHVMAASLVPDAADREFINRAIIAGEAELKIARMALRNAGREETRYLARRLATYHVLLSAALREFARVRKIPTPGERDAKLKALIQGFQEKKGRAYDTAFRKLQTDDPLGLLALYGQGAASISDRLLRRLAEKVYGELKTQRPAAARAYQRKFALAAQQKKEPKAKGKSGGSIRTPRKTKSNPDDADRRSNKRK